MDRALDYESRGRTFESYRLRHFRTRLDTGNHKQILIYDTQAQRFYVRDVRAYNYGMKYSILMLLCLFSFNVLAKEWSCLQLKTLPKIFEGCEGEACGALTYERAVKDVDLYRQTNSVKPFMKVSRCIQITYFEPFYILKKAGRVKFLKSLKEHGVEIGDTAYFVRSVGEGYFDVCLNDKIIQISALPEAQATENKETASILYWGVSEHWIKTKFSNGAKGFTKNDSHSWYQGYYTYEPSEHCPDSKFPRTKIDEVRNDCFKETTGKKCPDGKFRRAAAPSCVLLDCNF